MDKSKIQHKIEQLKAERDKFVAQAEAERDKFVAQANVQIAFLNGKIAGVEELLEPEPKEGDAAGHPA